MSSWTLRNSKAHLPTFTVSDQTKAKLKKGSSSSIVPLAVTMVTLDQSMAVNTVQAHIGDNVEIRCDITGRPQQPAIKWFRYNVDLASLNIPNIKVI